MKTKFELDCVTIATGESENRAEIIGFVPDSKPYVHISISKLGKTMAGCIKDKDLERFSVNILKAIKSKRLKNNGKDINNH